MKKNNEDIKSIETIKALSLDMINTAGSGHPGIALGAAPIIYTIFAKHLNFNSSDPLWPNRDRFVLSAGHASALLYSTLYVAGYNINANELKKFRQINSILPGHPERGITPGVEVNGGMLGQGFSTAVGMAFAERYLRELLNYEIPKQILINHYIYVLCSDGDLMEGISNEAASFAGTQKLDKLIVLYDSNNISSDGSTNKTFTENVLARFAALGWHTQLVKNGEDCIAIDKAIRNAKNNKTAPSIIEIKTIIGSGSKNAGKELVHSGALAQDDYNAIREKLEVRDAPFSVSKDGTVNFRNQINNRAIPIYNKWLDNINNITSSRNEYVNNILQLFLSGKCNINFDISKFTVNDNYADDMRNSNNVVMNIVSEKSLFFLGGSADMASSCQTILNKTTDSLPVTPTGKNIPFGIREHAMGAILNGMAIYGLRVFGSTHLVFSDYQKPALRMSALMNLPVTYIYTHDSINIGQDGATHQPIEQISALRSIPNLTVYRPADINEIIGSWSAIVATPNPSVLIIGKNKQENLKTTNSLEVQKGAYIVRRENNRLDAIIVATGSEVATALKISEELYNNGIDIRVISMPSIELFNLAGTSYHETLFPIGVKTITLEASNDPIWYKFTTNNKFALRIDDFGYSGKSEDVLRKMEFDYDSLKDKIEKLIK